MHKQGQLHFKDPIPLHIDMPHYHIGHEKQN